MRGTLKRYDGVYGRLFIAPTVFIGLGRWGNVVCDRFFNDLLITLAPSQRLAVPSGAPKSITDCFSRLAWVRDMDRQLPEIGWATDKQYWPPNLDAVDGDRFSDISGEDSLVSFWSTPRACFHSALDEQWQILVPTFKRLQERVSSANWRDGCLALGLKVPPELESTDKWIVTVGSLFEPEVGVVIADFARFVQEHLRAGESGYKFLHVIDVGMPADPGQQNEIWVTCPRSLQAQLLSGVERLGQISENTIFFYCTSTDRSGYRVAVAERTGSALGVLRSYFTSSLLSPRDRTSIKSSIFKNPKQPTAVSADRTSVFMEFALDLDNLDTLIARELLARWKRRFFIESAPLVEFEELIKAFTDRQNVTPTKGRGIFADLAVKWFQSTGLNPRQEEVLETFKTWVAAGKEHMVESIARDSETQVASASVSDSSPWQKLKAIFGFARRAPLDLPTSGIESLRQKVEFSDEVLVALTALMTLIREVATPESAFQDVTYDTHLEIAAVTPSTFVAKYKRLPQDSDCPVHIRDFLSRSDVEIPAMILNALFSPEQAVAQVIQQAAARWGTETKRQDSDSRWMSRGIAQWIRHDASLSAQVATYAVRKLVPLWKPLNYRTDNWHGFLTVFDYGVQLSSEPTTESSEALKSLRKAFGRLGSDSEMKFGVSKQGYASALENEINWERWPNIDSFGLLWTDTARDGMGFCSDWDKQELLTAADEWKTAFPLESAWISCRGPGDGVNPGGES
jgi:hypothetical protein